MYVENFAVPSIDLFSLIHAVMGILKFRVDPSIPVAVDFPSDVVLKNTSESLQKSFVSNHSSWIF